MVKLPATASNKYAGGKRRALVKQQMLQGTKIIIFTLEIIISLSSKTTK